jgi:hypothetical protein
MIKEYKITLRQQLSVSSSAWIKYLLFFAAYFYFLDSISFAIYLSVILIYSLFDLLPAIFLHANYFKRNRRDSLHIDNSQKILIYESPQQKIKAKFDDIIAFRHVVSYGNDAVAPGWYSFGTYRYCEIIFKDTTKIAITCLMVPDILHTLETSLGMSASKKVRLLPLLPKRAPGDSV